MNVSNIDNRANVSFFVEESDWLTVTIDTDRLHMRSVEASESDYNCYGQLFGDLEVMGKYADGSVKTRDEIKTRVNNLWVKRWKESDPFSALAVFKKDEDTFLGHVVLGHGDAPGQSELAYLFMRNHWKRGYGTEAVTAVVQEYAPATISKGYLLEGKALEKITATARTDNPGSYKILERNGMQKIGEEVKFGGLRCHYSLDIGLKV